MEAQEKPKGKVPEFYHPRNEYTDRRKIEQDNFGDNPVTPKHIETYILLLETPEESVYKKCLELLVKVILNNPDRVIEFTEKKLLDQLLKIRMFYKHEDGNVRADALFLTCSAIEKMNTLQELTTEMTCNIMCLCLSYYLWECSRDKEDPEIGELNHECIEFLTVIINRCTDDPKAIRILLHHSKFLETLFDVTNQTSDADILLHSVELIHKIIQMQNTEDIQRFVALPEFPIDRFVCELTGEYPEERGAILKLIRTLIADNSAKSVFNDMDRATAVVNQLTKALQDNLLLEQAPEIAKVLAIGMRNEKMATIFFEQNLLYTAEQMLKANLNVLSQNTKCAIISVFAEIAQFERFLPRLHVAHVPDLLMDCLLQSDPFPSSDMLLGIERIIKYPESAKRIADENLNWLVEKLLLVTGNNEAPMHTREQCTKLIERLLAHSFEKTATELINLNFVELAANVLGRGLENLSIDLILSLLRIIETVALNGEYRSYLSQSALLTQSLATLLKNSFASNVLVTKIFRCLCTLVEDEVVQNTLLANFIIASTKRALRLSSKAVKSIVTNFIGLTARFQRFAEAYIDHGVLEILIMNEKDSAHVPTWKTAIESILSKTPTIKFCVRNHLSMTDSIVGSVFFAAKQRFNDFRVFQEILKNEVSPLFPVLCVNFEDKENRPDQVVEVPMEQFADGEVPDEAWLYCRTPGDEFLPEHLKKLVQLLSENGMFDRQQKVKRCVDFDIIARNAKLVAKVVVEAMSEDLKTIELNSKRESRRQSQHDIVTSHLKGLIQELHCSIIPIGMLRSGGHFERAVLFKGLADQIALPCTLQRSVNGKLLFNEIPLRAVVEHDIHCEKTSENLMPWPKLRPTHIVDLMYNAGELYPIQSQQSLQYLGLG